MSDDQPENPGQRYPDEQRARNNIRAADRERERQSVHAIQHLTAELGELANLRSQVAVALAILKRGEDRQAAIDALERGNE